MMSDRRSVKIALASWVAASIEWYDFFIYGTAAALVFPKVYFPSQNPVVGTLLSFATFGVAFVARPVGGALFGHIGDSSGRKRALVGSLLAMGGATTLIGVLPSYSSIGLLAPAILVVLRFIQGIAVGGQQGGVIVFATESVPARRRGMYSSFASAGAPGGVILANLAYTAVIAAMPGTEFRAWGWRIPFLISLLLIGIAVIIQLRLDESAEFEQAGDRPVTRRRSPVVEAIRTHPKQIAMAAGCYLAINLNYYVFITFVVAYATNAKSGGMAQGTVLTAVLIASVIELVALPAAGLLSDRLGRRRIFTLGATLLGVWSFAFWPLVNTRSTVLLTVALIVGLGLLHSLMYGPQPALFAEAFSTQVRYSSVSLGMQLGSLLGGAFAPFLATALVAAFGSTLPIAIYTAIGCAITLVCGLKIRPAPAITAALHGARQRPPAAVQD